MQAVLEHKKDKTLKTAVQLLDDIYDTAINETIDVNGRIFKRIE